MKYYMLHGLHGETAKSCIVQITNKDVSLAK